MSSLVYFLTTPDMTAPRVTHISTKENRIARRQMASKRIQRDTSENKEVPG